MNQYFPGTLREGKGVQQMRTRILSLALAICMIFAIFPVAVFADDNTVIISTAEDFDNFAESVGKGENYSGKTVKLANDISLASSDTRTVGTSSDKPFSGTFDGQGHSITIDYTRSTASMNYAGLFGVISGATIKNLNLIGKLKATNSDPIQTSYVGALAGYAENSQIINCAASVSIDVSGSGTHYVGGLVGGAADGTSIVNSCVYGTKSISSTESNDFVGGLIGAASGSDGNEVLVANCYVSTWDVNASGEYAVHDSFIADNRSSIVKLSYSAMPSEVSGVTCLLDDQIKGEPGVITGSGWTEIKINDISAEMSLISALNIGVEIGQIEFSEANSWSKDGDYPLPFTVSAPQKPTVTGRNYMSLEEGYNATEVALTYTGTLYVKGDSELSLKDGKISIPAGLEKGTYTITVFAFDNGLISDYFTFTLTVTEKDAPHVHSYKWVVVREATYTSTGLEEYRCACGDVSETREIPKLEKNFHFDIAFLVFETNGGDEIKGISTLFGTKVNLKAFTPVREGYEFTGWYSDKALTKPVDEVMVIGVTTVYAGWEEDSLDFIDVDKDDKYYDDIKFVFDSGLMIGTSSVTFSPDMNLSRAMVVTILWRINGSPVVNFAMDFEDVDESAYYAEAVRFAQAQKIVNGVAEKTFAPDDNITREQLATIIYRYVQQMGGGFTGAWYFPLRYEDASEISEYADEAMHWCVMKGIIEADEDNNLRPTEPATRAETAHAYHVLDSILADLEG